MSRVNYQCLTWIPLAALSVSVACAKVGPIPDSNVVPIAADRIRNEPASVWVEFIQLAIDWQPLNLGQGFPDFAAPQYLVESLENATRLSDPKMVLNHQYTRSFGHPRLVRALQAYYKNLRGFESLTSPMDQVLVTVGAYEALFTAIMAFVNPGDEVILVDPAFDAYAPMVNMAGGKNVFIPLKPDLAAQRTNRSTGTEHYRLDMQELRSKINNRTRAIVLNTPNNPLGKVFSLEELRDIAQVCIENNMLVIADEVYEQFYYDDNRHISIASLPGMWQRTITIGSAGKTFSVTGWKIGWAFGPEHLIRYMQLVHQTAVYTVATPLQEAVARALEHEMQLIQSGPSNQTELYWSGLRNDLKFKRDKMAALLERAHMRPLIPQGGYFMMADFSQLTKLYPEFEKEGRVEGRANTNDYKFARYLSKVKKLQGIPGSAFYSEANKALGRNLIRLCFIKKEATLNKFDELIGQLIK